MRDSSLVLSVSAAAVILFRHVTQHSVINAPNIMTKKFLALLIAANLCVGSQFAGAADPAHPDQPIVPLTEAISRLKDGNARYTNGKQQHPRQATKERAKLTKSQHPFAIVIGCADSRVPPEIVFDQGLGDLFVLRVAGNVIDNHSLGSIEYAVDHLAVR